MESTTTPRVRRPLQVKAKLSPQQVVAPILADCKDTASQYALPRDVIETCTTDLDRAHKLLNLLEVVLLETDEACIPEEHHIVNTFIHAGSILDRVAGVVIELSNANPDLHTLIIEARAIAGVLDAVVWNGASPIDVPREVLARVTDALGDCIARAMAVLYATPIARSQP